VDNLRTIPTDLPKKKDQKTALRAGSDKKIGPDWEVTVPTSRFAMLIAADWLRRRLPVFASCSRKLVRHLCKPYWRAGWCNRDIVYAMDHRPGLFNQPSGILICPQQIAAPKAFIASRLAAWRTPEGAILPGHWTSRLADAAAAQTARQLVAARHGRAGAALLRPGEHTLTATRITEHGHATRPPRQPHHPRRRQSHPRRHASRPHPPPPHHHAPASWLAQHRCTATPQLKCPRTPVRTGGPAAPPRARIAPLRHSPRSRCSLSARSPDWTAIVENSV
jgi:hypothetical protein